MCRAMVRLGPASEAKAHQSACNGWCGHVRGSIDTPREGERAAALVRKAAVARQAANLSQ